MKSAAGVKGNDGGGNRGDIRSYVRDDAMMMLGVWHVKSQNERTFRSMSSRELSPARLHSHNAVEAHAE